MASGRGAKSVVKTKQAIPIDQHARFLEAARKAGTDMDTSAADVLMGKLAKTKLEPKLAKKRDQPRIKDEY